MNAKQLKMLKDFGVRLVQVRNGIATYMHDSKVIPDEYVGNYNPVKDGMYYPSEATCGNAVISPSGKNIGTQAPQHLKDKFECRIGRHAPHCKMFAERKCAKVFLYDLSDAHLPINAQQLIDVINVGD